jgi:hypothetical protein
LKEGKRMALKQTEDPTVARIHYELSNAQRYDIEWEWIAENDEGEYLERDEVLKIVAEHLMPSPTAERENDV